MRHVLKQRHYYYFSKSFCGPSRSSRQNPPDTLSWDRNMHWCYRRSHIHCSNFRMLTQRRSSHYTLLPQPPLDEMVWVGAAEDVLEVVVELVLQMPETGWHPAPQESEYWRNIRSCYSSLGTRKCILCRSKSVIAINRIIPSRNVSELIYSSRDRSTRMIPFEVAYHCDHHMSRQGRAWRLARPWTCYS